MEASLCGVTCICSPVRAYTDVISHGETGLIAETAEQWHQAITSLINDPSKSRLMGQKARLHANNIFDSEAGKEFWRHRIADTISGRSSDRPCKKVLVMKATVRTMKRQNFGCDPKSRRITRGLEFRISADAVARPPRCSAARRGRREGGALRTTHGLPEGGRGRLLYDLLHRADARGV